MGDKDKPERHQLSRLFQHAIGQEWADMKADYNAGHDAKAVGDAAKVALDSVGLVPAAYADLPVDLFNAARKFVTDHPVVAKVAGYTAPGIAVQAIKDVTVVVKAHQEAIKGALSGGFPGLANGAAMDVVEHSGTTPTPKGASPDPKGQSK